MTAKEIFKQILEKRGITDIDSFVHPKYEDLANPFLLADMDKAVERIEEAVRNQEVVAVYGDYDIDGMTATTILSEALRKFGLQCETFIPDRFVDGYGLGERGIDELKKKGVSLLLTVDTGSLSHEHVLYAKKHAIDVIVTDHHTVGDTLPEAVAVINPKRPESKYPYIHNAGVGVAFTLIRALQTKLDGLEKGQEKWLLDLVALGTVCDVVPLTGENRILVYYGLKVMQNTRRPGLIALAQVSDAPLNEITSDVFGWRFGPRLNASGRLIHAKTSMDLLAASDRESAADLALQLDSMNAERRSIQKKILTEAVEQAEQHLDDDVLVLAGSGWSHGVVGIVASSIVEKYKKPAFVLEINGSTTKGSARSFGDFHLAHAIKATMEYLEKGGGHGAAAGITMDSKNLEAFRAAINTYFKELKLTDQLKHLMPSPDVVLDDFSGLDDEFIELASSLEPYGTEHEQPLFATKNVMLVDWRPVGADKTHAKATLQDSKGEKRDSIGFGIAEKMPDAGSAVTVLFYVEHNEWNGRKTIQHKLVDVSTD